MSSAIVVREVHGGSLLKRREEPDRTSLGGMNPMTRAALFTTLLVLLVSCSAPPKTATSVLQDAQKALGDVKTIQFSGTGMSAFVGQALAAGEPWPARQLSSFTETINYDQKSAKVDLAFA